MNDKGNRVRPSKPFTLPPEDWSPGDREPLAGLPSIYANRWDAPPRPDIRDEMRLREAFKAQLPQGQQFMEQQPSHLRSTLYNNLGSFWGAVPEGVEAPLWHLGLADWPLGAISSENDVQYALASQDPGRMAGKGAEMVANVLLPHIATAAAKKAAPMAKAVFQGGRDALAELMNPKFGGSGGRR